VSENAIPAKDKRALENAVEESLRLLPAGTRYGIRMDSDGLLAAGQPELSLPGWMRDW